MHTILGGSEVEGYGDVASKRFAEYKVRALLLQYLLFIMIAEL
jgi:hypothetical protein